MSLLSTRQSIAAAAIAALTFGAAAAAVAGTNDGLSTGETAAAALTADAGLPVLQGVRTQGDAVPATEAELIGIEGNLDVLASSRAVATESGRGWVLQSAKNVCLAVPDPLVEGYGIACVDRATAAAQGVWGVLAPPDPEQETVVSAVLPKGGAVHVENRAGKSAKLVSDAEGVISEKVRGVSSIAVVVDGVTVTQTQLAPPPSKPAHAEGQ